MMKMNVRVLSVMLALGAVMAFGFPAPGLGGKIDSFTADHVYIDSNGEAIAAGKIYMTPTKMRMDGIPGPEKGQSLGIIYHKNEKRQCMFNPQKKLYFEGPLDEGKMKQDMKSFGDVSEKSRVVGTEKVNGYKCTKKEVDMTVKVMGFTQKSRLTVWVSDRFDMPLRTRSDDGSITELRHIIIGAPKNNIFETPKGYKRVGSMMALMGMTFSEPDNDLNSDDDSNPDETVNENAGDMPFKIPGGLHEKLKGLKLPFGKKN
jgi:hypothetical protein